MHAQDAQRVARLAEALAREATLKKPNQLEKALHEQGRRLGCYPFPHPALEKNFAGARTILAVHSSMIKRAPLGVIGFLSLCFSVLAQQTDRPDIFHSLNSSPPRFPSLTLSNG